MYAEGGILSVTSRILVVDLLSSNITMQFLGQLLIFQSYLTLKK